LALEALASRGRFMSTANYEGGTPDRFRWC
jgi:hypothetical protein